MRRNLFICVLLAGVTLAIYWPVRHYGIINYDDPLFTTENGMVKSGLNWQSVWWALSGVVAANWHPVTSLSFVVDNQIFGANPGAEHVVNVAFHAVNAVLLFLVLIRLTGSAWRSAVVAAFFAWHPLRVESVAWICERKDVLCGFFFLLTLLGYVRYVEKSGVQPPSPNSSGAPGSPESTAQSPESTAQSPQPAVQLVAPKQGEGGLHPLSSFPYWLALVFFVLGYMSKPMIVTLPFVLLLLDVWPLNRFTIYDTDSGRVLAIHRSLRFTIWPLIREKLPFFLLSAVFSWLTYDLQKTHAAVVQLSRIGLDTRLGNAVNSYLQYLAKLFWPAKLAVIYPYPKSQNDVDLWLTVLLLLAISVLCVYQLARRPYLAVGWFWFLGTSVPIIGLVQVGEQAMANRYTYLPLIGPVISLVWLAADTFKSNFSRKFILAPATVVLLAACILAARWQVQLWKNTVTLCEYTVAVTSGESSIQYCLGSGLEQEGRLSEALMHYRIYAALWPQDYRVHYSLAQVLGKQGHWAEAMKEYQIAADLGANPNDYVAHLNFADAFAHLGRFPEAVEHLDAALRLNPDSPDVLNNLAWTLATCPDAGVRDGARAVELAQRACVLTHYTQTTYVGTLAAAYAEAGKFDDAMATAQKACALAAQSGDTNLLQKNRELLERYRRHQPARE